MIYEDVERKADEIKMLLGYDPEQGGIEVLAFVHLVAEAIIKRACLTGQNIEDGLKCVTETLENAAALKALDLIIEERRRQNEAMDPTSKARPPQGI